MMRGPPDDLGGRFGGSERVGRPTRRSGRGQVSHPKVWEGLVGPPRSPGEVGKPTRTSG